MDHIKNRASHFDHLRLPQSERKVREISQPVKIAQLLGSSGKAQTGPKNSAIKISQPERLTPYLKNISTQKKKKINQLHQSEKKVRRNLNFAELPTYTSKSTSNLHDNTGTTQNDTNQRDLHSFIRKSFILPPNTIKDRHIKDKFKKSKSMLTHINQTHALMAEYGSKSPRRFENALLTMENANAPIDLIHKENEKISVIQHTSSRTFNTNDQSDINNLHNSESELTNMNNDKTEKEVGKHLNFNKVLEINIDDSQSDVITTNKLQLSSKHKDTEIHNETYNGEYLDLRVIHTLPAIEKVKYELSSIDTFHKEKCLSKTTNDHKQEVYKPLKAIKTFSESHNPTDREYICVDKKELTVLTSTLKHLICRLEQDVSYLKSTLTSVTNLLSVDLTNEITGNNETENEQMIENLNNCTKRLSNIKTKSVSSLTTNESIDVEEAKKTLIFYSSRHLETDDSISKSSSAIKVAEDNSEILSSHQMGSAFKSNKENDNRISANNTERLNCKPETRRRSARLMAKALRNSITENDSFINLENELNITNTKSNMMIASCTPVMNKCKEKKTERALMEYMVLKSRMSCLLTPNIKRSHSLKPEDNKHSESNNAKASLSDKVLAELQNLYADSPDQH